MAGTNRYRVRRLVRRMTLFIVMPALLLLALRIAWGWEAANRLVRVHAQFRAEGLLLEEPPANTPEEQDPSAALIKATGTMSFPSPAERQFILDVDGDASLSEVFWTEAHKSEARRIVAKNEPAFRWIDSADERRGRPVKRLSTQQFFLLQQMGRLFNAAAIMAHEDHQDAEALHNLRRNLLLSRAVDQDRTEIGHLHASAFRGLAAATFERLESTIHLDAADGSENEGKLLLRSFAGMDEFRANAAGAYDGEFAWAESWFNVKLSLDEWWIRPLRIDDEARALLIMERQRDGTRADNWPLAYARLPVTDRRKETNLERIALSISDNFNDPGMYMEMHFRAVSDSSAAAALLAARLYQHAHGRLPDAITQLVPEFLPATPVDPFSASHEPMHYRLDPEGPTLWSIGENGTDEGGPVQFESGQKKRRYDNNSPHSQPDIVYGSAWTRAQPPPAPAPPAPRPRFTPPPLPITPLTAPATTRR